MHRDDLPPDPPGDDDAQTEDPDRAAILARRKRFIAIALSGLASGVGCAEPCLKVAAPPSDGNEQKADPPAKTDATPTPPNHEPAPEACLKIAGPSTKEAEPQACLKVAGPSTKEAEPQACLNVAMPEPESPPKPAPEACLRVARPRDDAKARPTPCLKIARPKDE
jgi:hypothetical protein